MQFTKTNGNQSFVTVLALVFSVFGAAIHTNTVFAAEMADADGDGTYEYDSGPLYYVEGDV